MSKLWKWVEEKKLSKEIKPKVFLIINCIKYSFYGLVAWLLVSRFALNTIDWAICFIGYPGFFIGFIGGYLYLCKQN